MRNSSSSPYGTRVSEQRYRTFEPFSGAWSRSWFDGAHHLFSISCACSEPVSAPDGYALGLLLCAVFNPTQPPSTTAKPPPSNASSLLQKRHTLIHLSPFKKLFNPNSKSRMSPKNVLDVEMAESGGEGHGFFVHNRLVKVCAELDRLNLSSKTDKASFLRYVIS